MTTVVDDDADGAVAAAGDVAPVLRGGVDAILWYGVSPLRNLQSTVARDV